ncbi:MAG: GNAT family N-acetyltransferase, partial [Methyloligellaceae bacterium]
FTEEMATGFLRSLRAGWGADGFAFSIYRIDGPPLIGMTGLHGLKSGAPTIHYWLAPDARGLGYATEAARALLGFAFETLRAPHVDADHFLDNPASGRVLEKCGFIESERRDVWSRGRGRFAPGRVMRLTRADWLANGRDEGT